MLRIVHGPANLANQPWVLSRYERQLGAASDVVVAQASPQGYPADRFLSRSAHKTPLGLARRAWFGLTAPLRYDVLHAYFGRSWLAHDGWGRWGPWRVDLSLAQRLGRKVFMTFQGCDARQADRTMLETDASACRADRCRRFAQCRAGLDDRRRRMIEAVAPLCDRMFVLNPDLLDVVPGSVFLPYASVDVEHFTPRPPRLTGPIRIVHAPTEPTLKGTAAIEQAVRALSRHWPIEWTLLTGQSHATTLATLASADLVIDQMLLGWYGGLSVEAMALGKPVVCFLRERDLARIPKPMRQALPIMNADPTTLAARLEDCFQRRETWLDWSARSRAFVLDWHHPRRIAAAMLDAYADPHSRFELPCPAEAVRCAA